MICLAALKRNRISLHSLLQSRDHVTSVLLRSRDTTSLSFWESRDTATLSSKRSCDPAVSCTLTTSRCLATTGAGKSKLPTKKKTKKKDSEVLLLYNEKRDKCSLYLTFFTCLPLAIYVSGVGPYSVSRVGEVYPDMGLAYMFNLAAPAAVVAAFYCLVIIWGLRFPRRMELTKDMKLRMHIIKWPGYKACVTVDPSGMRIHRENKKVYSVAKGDLYVNYTLNKKWGTIERRDILDKLFGKYDPKKDKKLSQHLKEEL